MPDIVVCGSCGLEFEVYKSKDGQLCTCPRCFETGRLKATEAEKWKLEIEGVSYEGTIQS